MGARILLVEDDDGIALGLVDRLAGEGYEVERVADGETASERLLAESYALVVLDLMLPGRSGIDVCRDLRERGERVPVLMLTARDQTVDKVLGLKIGADDYVTKPFEPRELLARVESLLRRAKYRETHLSEKYSFGEIEVDFTAAVVHRGGDPVALPALEYKLLCYFIAHRQEMLSRDRLLDEVWGYDRNSHSRTVDQHVASLRRKIEPNPSKPDFILTTHGLGYRFVG